MHARISRVIYGARDAKTGGSRSVVDLFGVERPNHHAQRVEGGCWLNNVVRNAFSFLPSGAKPMKILSF